MLDAEGSRGRVSYGSSRWCHLSALLAVVAMLLGLSGLATGGDPSVAPPLVIPIPAGASSAQLLEIAADYVSLRDEGHYRQALQQVISTYPGTKDAGRALVLLAENYSATGDQPRANALSAQIVAGYPDPEIQAFAELVPARCAASKAKQLPSFAPTLVPGVQSPNM